MYQSQGTCIRSCEEADANGVVSFDEMGSGEQSHLFVSLADKKVQVSPLSFTCEQMNT